MGLILDTNILIAVERSGKSFREFLSLTRARLGEVEIAVSTISVVELTHGIYRAVSEAQRAKRRTFAETLFADVPIYPVTLEIAKLAGRIDGECAAKGNSIAFEDLVIGATALHLGYDVATLNVRHFERIPGLKVVTL